MKIRNGFVSNSSSSSFVIIGVKRTGSYDDIHNEKFDDKDIKTLYVEFRDTDYITGVIIQDTDEELVDKTITFEEFNKIAEKVSKALNVKIENVSLISGTRPC